MNFYETPEVTMGRRWQRCLRCGTDEWSSRSCSWCKGAEYELVEHRHTKNGHGLRCPLGPTLNPSGHPTARSIERLAGAARKWADSPAAVKAERYITRRWTHEKTDEIAVPLWSPIGRPA